MKVDVRPRNRNAPRPAHKSARGFLQWIRGRRCACGGHNPNCGGKMQAAHGPDKASKGFASKSIDVIAMPLSANCHMLQHSVGWPTFAGRFLGRDPREVCLDYWHNYPKRHEWEAEHGAVS